MRSDWALLRRGSSHKRVFGSLIAMSTLAICTAACRPAEVQEPSLTRLRGSAEKLVEVAGVGRQAQPGRLPLMRRRKVVLPAAARLRLWWTLDEGSSSQGDVRLSILAGEDHRPVHEHQLEASAATSWIEEVVDLSQLGAGPSVLEVGIEVMKRMPSIEALHG